MLINESGCLVPMPIQYLSTLLRTHTASYVRIHMIFCQADWRCVRSRLVCAEEQNLVSFLPSRSLSLSLFLSLPLYFSSSSSTYTR